MAPICARQAHDVVVIGKPGDTLFLLCGASASGVQWLATHFAEDASHLGRSVFVEHRYVTDLIEGMAGAGLRLGFWRSCATPQAACAV